MLGHIDRPRITTENVWVTLAERLADCVAEAIISFWRDVCRKEEGCFVVHGVDSLSRQRRGGDSGHDARRGYASGNGERCM